MKDYNSILSYSNDQIKKVEVEDLFLLAPGETRNSIDGSIIVDDNNIIPVYLRTTLQWPNSESGTPPALPEGIYSSAQVWMDAPGGLRLFGEYVANSIHSPVCEREIFGGARKIMSDFETLEFAGWVMTIGGGFISAVAGRFLVEFYYIPIRYP